MIYSVITAAYMLKMITYTQTYIHTGAPNSSIYAEDDDTRLVLPVISNIRRSLEDYGAVGRENARREKKKPLFQVQVVHVYNGYFGHYFLCCCYY